MILRACVPDTARQPRACTHISQRVGASASIAYCQFCRGWKTLLWREALDDIAGADALRGEPSLAHLARVERQSLREMRRLVLGPHVLDVDDATTRVDERDRQRHVRVLHPE